MDKQKGISLVIILIIIAALGTLSVIGTLVYMNYSDRNQETEKDEEVFDEVVELPEQEIITKEDEWNLYINDKYGFQFEYPKIYDEGEESFVAACGLHGSDENINLAGRIFINVIDSEGLTLEEYIDKEIEELGLLEVDKGIIDDFNAGMSYRLPGSMAFGMMSYMKNTIREDGKIYMIGTERVSYHCDYDDVSIFDVLSHAGQTFTFIERTEEVVGEEYSIYKNKELGFGFKIAPLFEENGCTISEFDYPYYFDDGDQDCLSLAFETMPIEPVGWTVDPDEQDEMFHINICPIEYCDGDGEENCNYIRTGDFIDDDWPVWTQYITENDKYFIYALTGSSYGDHLDSRGWYQESVRGLRTRMIDSIRFIDDLPVETKKQWMEEEMDTGCDYANERLRDRDGEE